MENKKIAKDAAKAVKRQQRYNYRLKKKELKYLKKLRKKAIRDEKRSNLYALREYTNGLDVSDKVNKYLYVHSHNDTPERVARLTKYYRNKEFRRIKRKYSKYF